MTQTWAKEELKRAIDFGVGGGGTKGLLQDLNAYGIKLTDFDRVAALYDWAGSFVPGQQHFKRFHEVFDALGNEDKSEVKNYYQTKVSALPETWKHEFPKAF